ncbi:MAG TPA: NAD-dependent epimerase/dehydratase family protein [Nocardioidaceae bacterium]|nr:NAD-dependent epimerase/dehydratase family protein [Nocardioidaceae bacterium]
MRILIIGGTRFVGRHIAEAALAAGHDLTLLHRGKSKPDVLTDAEHLLADRDGDLSILDGRSFDATVDVCAYWPRQVRSLAGALGDRGGQHVYISSVSAYRDTDRPGGDESIPLATLDPGADPDDIEMSETTYGPLKALCEQAAVDAYGADRVTIVRPSYVVGPYDPTGRFTWWVDRIARGGPVLCPGPADSPMQLIDARDQGAWVVRLVESGTTGAFHSCSPEPPWSFADMVDAIAETLDAKIEPVWVGGPALRAEGVDGGDLPLWSEGADEQVLALDASAARASGLTPRPVAETIRDTAQWMASASWQREGSGLDPEREDDLRARLG